MSDAGHDDHGHGVASSPFLDGLRKVPLLGPLLVGTILYVKALWPHIEVPYVGWFFSLAIFRPFGMVREKLLMYP